jgi:hypothetical protein
MIHAGVVALKTKNHQLGKPIPIFHMTSKAIEVHFWVDGIPREKKGEVALRVDVAGHLIGVEKAQRQKMIRYISAQYKRSSGLNKGDSCYWAGQYSAESHPLSKDFPYSYTCATFVLDCYKKHAELDLVDEARMPFATDHERFMYALSRLQHDEKPFRRLCCGYLVGAFETELLPFCPRDEEERESWVHWKDECVIARMNAPEE